MTERKQAFLNDLIITNQHGVSVGGELNQATYVLTPGTEVVIDGKLNNEVIVWVPDKTQEGEGAYFFVPPDKIEPKE